MLESVASGRDRLSYAGPLVQAESLKKYFDVSGGTVKRMLNGRRLVKAVDDVSLEIASGETVALVGESGSGKSTMARLIAKLIPPTGGRVTFAGIEVFNAKRDQLKRIRKEIQFVFQDPFSSLNPRMQVEQIIGRPLTIHKGLNGPERAMAVADILAKVGLAEDHLFRYPHEFSGGQRQRIAIARALAPEPALILADEPLSSLDVSIQAQVLELLEGLRKDYGLAMLFITHDLNVAEFVSDRIVVLYGGKLMETGTIDEVLGNPLHPYTQSLLEARPRFGERRRLRPLEGEPSVPINPAPGCRFAARCPLRTAECTVSDIPIFDKGPGRRVACINV
ncbi:MAG: ATP-binding cassette domain-containing protein [Chloroflexi bacterium]|nr:ATP-binding cassette domain-containing protein [Chloroflexota bacterium]